DPAIVDRVTEVYDESIELLKSLADRASASCSFGGSLSARRTFGAADRLREVGLDTKADQIVAAAGIGTSCAYLLYTVEQEWEMHENGSAQTVHDKGKLVGAFLGQPLDP